MERRRPQKPTPPARPSESEGDVTWGDLDSAAIVFYPRFFAWADAAAHRLFARRGMRLDRLLAERHLSFGLVANLTTQMIFAATLHEITADWTWSGA